MMKFSRAISRVKWLSGEKTNVSKTISVLGGRLIARENFISHRFNFWRGAMMGFFLFATASRPALGHTQPPIQWVPGALLQR
jgi:hypothetical protein